MINSILLVDDENLFHLVFEDACSLLDITLTLEAISSSDEAEKRFKHYMEFPNDAQHHKPEVVFVDLNIIGSTFDGLELVNRINNLYGNGVVIGMISSSSDSAEIEKSKEYGAQFWIVKTDEIELRLERFREDYEGFKNKTMGFKVYR